MYDLMWDLPIDQRPPERRPRVPEPAMARVGAPWLVTLPFRVLRAGLALLRRAPARPRC